MDSAQPWISLSSSAPTNLDYRRIFDAYLYEYLLKRNLLTSAETFKQEAQIEDLGSILTDSRGDFLFDWWAIFYDSHAARLHGLQGNQTPLLSQIGQGSSSYDLPPFPPFLRDAGPMPLVDGTNFSPQAWSMSTPDGSSLIYRTSGIPQHWSVSNGSPLVTGAGDILSARWGLGGAIVSATEEYPLLYGPYLDPNISSRSLAPSTAVVLTPRNLTSVCPTQFLQRGLRPGSTPNDPIDVEAPISSCASATRGTSSASRGRRPRRQNQPLSRGSLVMGANEMPVPFYMPPPASVSMTQAGMANPIANYSRTGLFPNAGANSFLSLMANINASSESLVPSSLGMGGQVENYGPLLSHSQAILASTSKENSDAPNATNDQTSKTLITGTVGLSTVGISAAVNDSSSTKETAFEKSNEGGKPETFRQSSIPPTDPEKDNNDEEVSSGKSDSHVELEDTDENGAQHKENDKNVKATLTENNRVENEVDIVTVAPASQRQPEALQMQLQPQPSQLIQVKDEGFEFKQEACLEANLGEIWCCHFSSSGKYLACAGIDRKVIVWNMGTFVCTASEELHDEAIVDIRFKTNSSIFASASLDKTIRIWDASTPKKAIIHLIGHAANVTSLDFHPTNTDLLCSSDGNQEIRFWNISNGTCLHTIKGASQQVRFQTQKGKYLAAVAGNTINILDSETLTIMHTLKGHIRPVSCVCWDSSGRYLASASQESVHIWSVSSWCNSTHTLTAENGSVFKSCIFHPGISHVVIIGSDKNIEIWNPMENGKTLVVPAHESYVAGLTSSICTDIIASASHDGRVKLWR